MRSALHLAGIVFGLVVISHSRPYQEVSEDGKKSYVKFFNLEELIQKISFRKFKEFQKTGGKSSIPSIDLTQEAIVNDVENPEDSIVSEVIPDVTELSIIETTTAVEANDISGNKEEDDTAVEQVDGGGKKEEIDNSGGSSANFFISEESVQAAKKYGYKILLKKISGKVVPVGKIKFEFPILVEINPVDDEPEQVETDDTINDDPEQIVVEKTVVEEVEETTQLIADNSAVTITEQSIETTTETTTPEPIVIETTTQEEIIITTTIQPTTSIIETEKPASITTPSPRYLPPAEYYLAPGEIETAAEVISTYVSNEGDDSDNPVIEAVLKMAEDAEAVINIIKDLDTGAEVSLPNCAVPVEQVKQMLLGFVQSVETVLPLLQEVLDIGSGLAAADTEGRARIGAELLGLLESILDVIVPFQVSCRHQSRVIEYLFQIPGCSADASTSLLVSMSSLASQLDSYANVEPNQRKSKALHDKATSLQVSSWVMVQLKHAVKLFYSQDGICRGDSSPASTILDTLSRAVAGYAPVTTIIGNEESVNDLLATAAALKQTAEEIAKLEEAGFINDPRVPCDASFSEMGQAVSSVADALP